MAKNSWRLHPNAGIPLGRRCCQIGQCLNRLRVAVISTSSTNRSSCGANLAAAHSWSHVSLSNCPSLTRWIAHGIGSVEDWISDTLLHRIRNTEIHTYSQKNRFVGSDQVLTSIIKIRSVDGVFDERKKRKLKKTKRKSLRSSAFWTLCLPKRQPG